MQSMEDREAMSDIAERVKKIVVEHLGVDEAKVTEKASFIDDLGADSLDTVELVMAFEEEFGFEIPDDAAEKILTVSDAIEVHRGDTSLRADRLGDRRQRHETASDAARRRHRAGHGHAARQRRRADLGAAPRRRVRHPRRSSASTSPICPAKVAGEVPRGDRRAASSTPTDYVAPKDQRRIDDFILYAHRRRRRGGEGRRLEARGPRRSASAPA